MYLHPFSFIIRLLCCHAQVWWVKFSPWTSWCPKRWNAARKLLLIPNWCPPWPKRQLMQVRPREAKPVERIAIKWSWKSFHFPPCTLSAFEMTLAEGNHMEKRLFHATFATVIWHTCMVHFHKHGDLLCVALHYITFVLLISRKIARRAWLHLWRRERPIFRTSDLLIKLNDSNGMWKMVCLAFAEWNFYPANQWIWYSNNIPSWNTIMN